jgi:hypothetical protein
MTPMALPGNGRLGAIAGKKSLPIIEVAPAHARRMIAGASPNARALYDER